MPRSRTSQSQAQSSTSTPKSSAPKNSFGSCLVGTGFFKSEFRYEGRTRYCKCGVVSPRITAWTESNVGRRFYGCRYYGQEETEACNAFEWHDAEIVGRAHDVIWHLKLEYESLYSEFEELKTQCQNGGDDGIAKAIDKLTVRLRAIEFDIREMKSAVDLACENVCFAVQKSFEEYINKFQRNVLIVIVGLMVMLLFLFGKV